MRVCLAPSRLLWTPNLGGHAWANLNWAFGLAANGVDLVLLETLPDDEPTASGIAKLNALRDVLANLGLDAQIAVLPSVAQHESLGSDIKLEEVLATTDLFLNLNYSLRAALVGRFKRSALIDIDPGLLQMWLAQRAFQIAPHDLHFTIGETVGQEGSLVPDCGIAWLYTPPPVSLDAWPVSRAAVDAPFTTVTNWWANYEVWNGESFNNEKRASFMQFLKLPEYTGAPLELAIHHEEGEWSEMPKLRERGWRARPAHEVSGSPTAYRSYIQSSRGEFSCAKPSCMRFQNAWISDRTICYLASGKPAVVQHTGPSRFLPDNDGIFRFRTIAEAAAQLTRVQADYEAQCLRARALAEEHFDARRVVADVLERALS